jgi:hypothetical protein
MANNEQINVPSLLVILALSGLVVRYLFFSTPASSRAQQQASRESSTARNREAAVAQLQQMFPQVDRRTLLWDLQRTGGNMAATTERVLAGRLETVSTSLTWSIMAQDWTTNDLGKTSHPRPSNHRPLRISLRRKPLRKRAMLRATRSRLRRISLPGTGYKISFRRPLQRHQRRKQGRVRRAGARIRRRDRACCRSGETR